MKWCKNGGLFESDMMSLRVFQVRKKMNSQKCSRENWKGLKTDHFYVKGLKTDQFSWLNQVAYKSLGPTARTLERKNFEKFSKYFLWLEVPLTRESRIEPQKSLCTPRDWTFHPRTNHQSEPRKAWKTRFLKKILSLFCNWNIHPPMSR